MEWLWFLLAIVPIAYFVMKKKKGKTGSNDSGELKPNRPDDNKGL